MLEPFLDLFADFTPADKPILWLRIVGLAFLCNEFINRVGVEIGFQQRTIDCAELLAVSRDADILKKLDVYAGRCAELPATPL